MEDGNVPDIDWSGGRSLDDIRCDGKCSDELKYHLAFEEGEWYIVDGNWQRVMTVTHCPLCGKLLWKA